jgi:Tol biopolymer transport system component
VYRACDTNLHRDIALKVLPEIFAFDPDRLARFRREAQVLATLNHPNIAAIYGFEESNGSHALALELVDGPTLADRIALGPVPLDEAWPIARQIAQALEAAHDKGIIHRDLKPANIKFTGNGSVKVLDFGLAKVWDGAPHFDLSASPTLTAIDMSERTIMGTPAYMSPEQARGKPLDTRTDVWSFGCVLHEMLTGRALFAGDTISDTIAAVLQHQPDPTSLPRGTPMAVRKLLERCLEKDREKRLESAAAARLGIDEAIVAPMETREFSAARPRRISRSAMGAIAGGAAGAAFVVWAVMRPAPLAAPILPSRFAIVPPPAQPLNVSGPSRDLALSPDGRHLVYRFGGTTTAGSPLMVRAIDQLDARPVANVGGAYAPFFSPDSRWIAFFENTELKKVSIAGGVKITLCKVAGAPLGAIWTEDNTITFATSTPGTGLWRVSADGGDPSVLTTPDAANHETNHAFPSMLPGARGVLFTVATGSGEIAQVAVLDLKTGRIKTVVRDAADAQYVDGGHLVFAAGGTLRTVRFDAVRLEVVGDPVTVVERVMSKPSGAANYAVSSGGTLVYVPGGPHNQTPLRSLVWVDRKGHEEPIGAPPRVYGPPRISPDGTRVAIGIADPADNTEIWIWNLQTETLRRLTFSNGMDGLPVWTPDSRRIIFMSDRTGVLNLYGQAADGTGTIERLTTSTSPQWPSSITPDGMWLAGFRLLPRNKWSDIVFFPLMRAADGAAYERVRGAQLKGGFAEFSPNGRYLAYTSEEGGQPDVYVRPFPELDRRAWRISMAGGTRPVWARSGRELFYRDASNALRVVAVRTSDGTFTAGEPARMAGAQYIEPNPARHYDVSLDGERFVMIKEAAADPNETPAAMVVVQHWFADLAQRPSMKASP